MKISVCDVFHFLPPNCFSLKEITKNIIPKAISIINIGKLKLKGLFENTGIMKAAPNQPAHKLLHTSEAVRKAAGLVFINFNYYNVFFVRINIW